MFFRKCCTSAWSAPFMAMTSRAESTSRSSVCTPLSSTFSMSSKTNIRSCRVCAISSSARRSSSIVVAGMKFRMAAADLVPPSFAETLVPLLAICFSIISSSLPSAAGWHAVQLRHPQQHLGLQPLRHLGQHLGGQIRIQVRGDDGQHLRMFLPDDLGNRARVHPLEDVQALALPAHQDAVDDAAGLVLAQGVGQHLADVVVGADLDVGLTIQRHHEIPDHTGDLVARGRLDLRHGGTQALHGLRIQVLEHRGGFVLAQGQQQHCGIVGGLDFCGHRVRKRAKVVPSRNENRVTLLRRISDASRAVALSGIPRERGSARVTFRITDWLSPGCSSAGPRWWSAARR